MADRAGVDVGNMKARKNSSGTTAKVTPTVQGELL
jgi:hypothetical protein